MIPHILFSTLESKGVKSVIVGLLVPKGRPRYGKGIVPTLHPTILARCKVLCLGVLIGTRKDLLKLTCKPVESEKVLNKHFRLKKVLVSPGRMSRVSLAYCIIGKPPPNSSLRGFFKIPLPHALLTMDCKRSAARTNRRGREGVTLPDSSLIVEGLTKYAIQKN